MSAKRIIIHHSWRELSAGARDVLSSTVRFDFSGFFAEGSHQGTAFAGRIEYDAATPPTSRHGSLAMYEEWPDPIVTIAVGGQVLTAQGTAVYHSVEDGCGRFDFVSMFGTGPFGHVQDSAFFELLFANADASNLHGTMMPSARQLQQMQVKQLSFGTSDPGNVISRGDLILHPAA